MTLKEKKQNTGRSILIKKSLIINNMPSANIYPNTYKCKKCGEDWTFFPEDYDYKKELYPTICPLCEMPISQMIVDVFQEEGIIEVFKRIWIRISK